VSEPTPEVQPERAPIPFRRVVMLGATAVLILGLGFGTVLSSGSVLHSTPSVSPIPTAGTSAFEAPGIAFEYPADWTDQTNAIQFTAPLGMRYPALMAHGVTVCPVTYDAAAPTPKPGSCDVAGARSPGSMFLAVYELLHQYPATASKASPATIAGYPVTESPLDPAGASSTWAVRSPDGGVYDFVLSAPHADLGARREDVRALLATLRLTSWESPPVVVDGHVRVDTRQGFSFDYRAGWSVYYPKDDSTTDGAVVTVSSTPVQPPCVGDRCAGFTTPPGTVAVQFRIGRGPTPPDWRKATTTIGGQPAFLENWGPKNSAGADEGHTWNVRMADGQVLGIYAALRGPDLPGLRKTLNELLATVQLSPQATPTP